MIISDFHQLKQYVSECILGSDGLSEIEREEAVQKVAFEMACDAEENEVTYGDDWRHVIDGRTHNEWLTVLDD